MNKNILQLLSLLLLLSCGNDVAITQTGNPSQVSLYIQSGKDTTQAGLTRYNRDTVKSVTVTSALLIVDEIELLGDDELAFERDEPYLINLASGTTRQEVDSLDAEAGTQFDTVLFSIRPLEDGDSLLVATHPELEDVAIDIKGFVNGDSAASFHFSIEDEADLFLPLKQPFIVNSKGTSALLIQIDIESWFKDEDGYYFDIFDTLYHEDIEETILESIEGFEEDEEDWEDEEDEEEHFEERKL